MSDDLRSARLRLGRSLRNLADGLRLSEAELHAVEEGRAEPPAVVREWLRLVTDPRIARTGTAREL